jgi:putative transcriptional regulator
VLLLLSSFLFGAGEIQCWAQEKPSGKLLFLVARGPVVDPFFEKSVVLMVPVDEDAVVVGLVVNKPSRLPLVKLFPESLALKNRTDNAYVGGPVDIAAPALVFHSPKPSKQAMLLYDDVYLSFDLKFITKLLRDPKQSGDFRLFLGRAQWAPEQLQGEALEGSWYSLRAEGDVIFDRDSDHVWKRLHDRAGPPPSSNPISLPQIPNGQPANGSWLKTVWQNAAVPLPQLVW